MYKLHYSPDTASLVVRVVLEELGLPYEAILIDRANHGLDAPGYRRLHPLGKIPAMETPEGPMFETAAILLWLADSNTALAPAPNSPERGAFLTWYFFTTSNIHPTLIQLFYPERTAGPECAEAVRIAARKRMEELLAIINTMVASKAPVWLSASQPSILGYYLGMLIRWMQFEGDDCYMPATLFPALAPVLRAHAARPAALAAARAEGIQPLYVKAE